MKLPTLTKNHTYLLLSGCLISLSIFIFKHKSEFLLKGWITVHGMEALHLVSFEEDGSFSAVIILGTAFAVSVIFSTLNICLKMTWFFWVVKIISGFVCLFSFLSPLFPSSLSVSLPLFLSLLCNSRWHGLLVSWLYKYLSLLPNCQFLESRNQILPHERPWAELSWCSGDKSWVWLWYAEQTAN